MGTKIFLGVKMAGDIVTESGSLNLPEPFGSHRPVMEILYHYVNVKILSEGNQIFVHCPT
jgi:hypothetical protein